MTTMRRLAFVLLLVAGGCAAPKSEPVARDALGVENVLVFDDGVISGSAPVGDDGFDALAAMGVTTVISVDGTRPDVARAEARGMRYIHVPIRYNGIDDDARLQLARALREADGPVFVHCHHGKHRGPAAAAYALVACDRITPAEGLVLLEEAGTSPRYPGLFKVVESATTISDADMTEAVASGKARLTSTAQVEGVVANMAAAGVAWDHLKLIRDAGWRTPPDHPDLVAASEAGILTDSFRALINDEGFAAEPADYVAWMLEARDAAQAIEAAIAANADASDAMSRLNTACNDCHAAYRDD